MAIDWPDNLCPPEMTWGMTYNNRVFASTLTNAQDVIALPGAFWECSLSFKSLNRQRERALTAFLGRLQGQFNTCKVPAFTRTRSDSVGDAVVVNASANAFSIRVGGVTPSAKVFRVGDYITVANQMFEVVEDATADGAGQALLVLNKRLRATLPAGSPVEYRNPYAVMRLAEDKYSMSIQPIIASGSIKLREAF